MFYWLKLESELERYCKYRSMAGALIKLKEKGKAGELGDSLLR
jgi:hypothetical protein